MHKWIFMCSQTEVGIVVKRTMETIVNMEISGSIDFIVSLEHDLLMTIASLAFQHIV